MPLYREEEVQYSNVYINDIAEGFYDELIWLEVWLLSLIIELTVVGNENHDLSHAG